jgi:hypothetical protein
LNLPPYFDPVPLAELLMVLKLPLAYTPDLEGFLGESGI